MKKVKAIHLITRLIVGGAQENTMDTCTYLDPKRFCAEIVSGPQTGPEGEIISEVKNRNIPLTIIPELVREVNPLKDLIALKKLVSLITIKRPHIVHTHSSKAGILGRCAARLGKVPIIVHTVHGWGHNHYQHFFTRALFILLERIAEKFTDKLIVVSRLNAEKGLHDGIGTVQKYVTIRSAVCIEEFMNTSCDCATVKVELGINPLSHVVGTVSRFSPQKNPLDFVRMAALIKERFPDVQFLFVGDGPLRGQTEALIRKLNLKDNFFITGLRRDVPRLLRCMDVFVLTSLWEGLPRVIPQAMASGIPVVATSVDGTAEIIQDGDTGFLVPPQNVALMSERVITLLKNSTMRGKIAQRGIVLAKREFSLATMINNITALYEDLLDKKKVAV